MFQNEAGDWQCSECDKISNNKNNIMEHIEASHVESPGYNQTLIENTQECQTQKYKLNK